MIALIWFVLAVLASPFKSKSRLEAENAIPKINRHKSSIGYQHRAILSQLPARLNLRQGQFGQAVQVAQTACPFRA
jgi:hypothetical protein